MASEQTEIKALHEAFKKQRVAYNKNKYPSLEDRKTNVLKIAGMLMSHRQDIRDALNADFGCHPSGAADVIETLGPAGRAQFVANSLEEWMRGEDRFVDSQLYGNAKAYERREPKGVVGVIVPFNFPFDLSAGPLCEILAGGNTCLIKPSEYTPACGALLKKMVNETYPAELVEVVLGGIQTGIEFTSLPFDHILYTGSPAVGKLVMKAAAANLTPVTLELGGKCPAILGPGEVNEENVRTCIGTKMLKNGQMCVSVDTIHVAHDELDKFVDLAKTHVASLKGYNQGQDQTGIITQRHLDRLVRLYDEAKSSGAQVVDLEPNEKADSGTRRMPLSLIINPDAALGVSKEEVFGPLLPVLGYSKLTDAVEHVNADERPLALYLFSKNDDDVEYVIDNTKSGGVTVNSCALQAAMPSLGFGGTGQSGMGRHHGHDGFLEFTVSRGIVKKGNLPDLTAAFLPPYLTAEAIADHAFAEAAKAHAVKVPSA